MSITHTALYNAALEADKRFQAQVIRQFGRKNAGTMRYIASKHDDDTRKAATEYWEAANAMLDEMKATRAKAVANG